MKINEQNTIAHAPTIASSLQDAIDKGFTANYKVISQGLCLEDEQIIYTPSDVKIANFYIFDSYIDPDDSSILYLVETIDGNKGTLLDAYGLYANPVILDFIKQVGELK